MYCSTCGPAEDANLLKEWMSLDARELARIYN
jgi:hypothetical protein